MMWNFILLFLLFLISCDSDHKQVPKEMPQQISTSIFDTLPNGQKLLDNLDSGMNLYYKEVVGSDTLKGGYITCYGIDDSMKYFYLREGNTLHLLNKTSKYTSPWSLGTLEEDFPNFFITRVDNGNSSPSTYQVFEKRNGKNILGDGIDAWSYQYLYDTLFFLYGNHDSVFLYNIKSGKRQGFRLPSNIPDYIYVDLIKLTKKSLTISYKGSMPEDNEKLVKYNR